jgi:phosphoribosylformylglycinamidine (FGAM) synthase-like amidotransferase family enzyme
MLRVAPHKQKSFHMKKGRFLGKMPHPEAYHHRTNHPCWTREELSEEGMEVAFFTNAVQYIRNHLL